MDISDWISESDDGGTADNRHPEAYESYQVKCYNNGPDVLYGNGLEIEQKFIKNINGMTLADYARTSDQMNLLDLLRQSAGCSPSGACTGRAKPKY